ncbi:MAG: S8 family peptidase, partial [Alphaproteobacteria bacterium]
MKKFLTACCVCSVLLQSVSGTAATVDGKPVQRYARPSVVRSQHNYTHLQKLAAKVERQEYNQIIDYLYADDYTGLRSAKENGLNINAHNRQGDTAVCTAVKAKRYRWFSMLKASGANVGEKCMEKIDIKAREEFIDGYTMRGGSLAYAEKEAMLIASSVNWLAVGGIAGGVALAGGATALALSGGGGGSSGKTTPSENEDIAPKDWPWHKSTDAAPSGKPVSYAKNPTTTDKTDPKYYKTAEFGGSNFSKAQNFLEQSGAQYAYAYAAAADAAVAGEGIIIGQVDTGIDYSHSELSGQIATDSNGNKLGINFHYGPCRNGDTTNCWLVDTHSMVAKFYDNNGTITQWKTLTSSELEAWTEYEPTFPSDYDWDANKYNMVVYGDKDTHGTHVAGIMAASKDSIGMHGLAYNSKIIGAAVDLDWLGSTREIYTSFRYLVDNDVSIINNSWGPSDEMSSDPTIARANFNNNYTTVKQAIDYARQNSVISVFAAGNSAFNYTGYENQGYNYNPMNANTLSGAPMAIPSLLYHWNEQGELEAYSSYPSDVSQIASSLFVTVVSVNENNEIAYYSQKCGPAAKWCIAAPGGEKREENSSIASTVGSSVSGTGYANYQGTSMATPVVSSALAVIMAAFPSLTAQEAVAVLFETAIDLGNEDMYGHGLLNLKGAMEPVGTLTLATGNTTSEKVVLNNTRITVPHSFEVSTDVPVEIMVLDKYKRGYNISTSALVRSTGHSKQIFANDLRLFTKSGKKQNVRFSDNLSFSFSDTKNSFDTNALAGKSFALTWNDEDKLEMTFSFSSDN